MLAREVTGGWFGAGGRRKVFIQSLTQKEQGIIFGLINLQEILLVLAIPFRAIYQLDPDENHAILRTFQMGSAPSALNQ